MASPHIRGTVFTMKTQQFNTKDELSGAYNVKNREL